MNRRTFVKSLIIGGAGLLAMNDIGKTLGNGQSGSLGKSAAARTLSEHRIAKMEVRRLPNRYLRFVGRNAFGKPSGRGGSRKIRIITTNKGATGWSQSWWPEEEVQKFIGVRLSDVFDLEYGVPEEAFPLDQPLYDLVGNILGKPVYELMGSKGTREVPIYSGAIYFDDLEPPENPRGVAGVLASCQQDYDVGYRAFKLKIGRGFKWMPREEGNRRDIEVTQAVHEHFPDCKVLVDANNGYTVEDFLDYVTATKDCDLFWIEEPFRENRDDLLKLRERMDKVGCKALIAEGEAQTERGDPMPGYGGYSQPHIETLFALAAEKLVDVFLLDLNSLGFSRWRDVMPELMRAGVQASPHTWASSLRSYYTAQLAAGVGNVVIVEGIPGTVESVDLSAYKLVDGKIVVPDIPGFGLLIGN